MNIIDKRKRSPCAFLGEAPRVAAAKRPRRRSLTTCLWAVGDGWGAENAMKHGNVYGGLMGFNGIQLMFMLV